MANVDFERTTIEAQMETQMFREFDVIVAVRGSVDTAATIAAARGGAYAISIERYPQLHGISTRNLAEKNSKKSDHYRRQHIGALCQEIIDRLTPRGGGSFP